MNEGQLAKEVLFFSLSFWESCLKPVVQIIRITQGCPGKLLLQASKLFRLGANARFYFSMHLVKISQ